MGRWRFLHAADLHLDRPAVDWGRGRSVPGLDAATASLDAFDRLVSLAQRAGVAFVLLAGDLYDGPERGLRAQLRFLRGLERLATAGIGVFVVHGNHDPLEGWSAIRAFPASVVVFGSERPVTALAPIGGGRTAAVTGISYARRDTRENLAARMRRSGRAAFEIGLLHANVGGEPDHAPYAPCTARDLAAARFDYWALGHVHQRKTLVRAPFIAAYSGTLQGRGFGAGELGAKGAWLVEVEDGVAVGHRFIACDALRFGVSETSWPADDDLGRYRARLLDIAAEAAHRAGDRPLALRVEVAGRAALAWLASGAASDDLARDIEADLAARGRRVRIVDIVPISPPTAATTAPSSRPIDQALRVVAGDAAAVDAILRRIDAPLVRAGWLDPDAATDPAQRDRLLARARRLIDAVGPAEREA